MSMAELPELEILRRDLDKDVVGKKIKTVEAPSAATIKRAGTKKSRAPSGVERVMKGVSISRNPMEVSCSRTAKEILDRRMIFRCMRGRRRST